MDLGSQLKTWKAFTILDAAKNTKNICYSWKEVPTLTWVWRTKTSAPTGDFEGIQDFSGRMDCRCVERARNLELKLGPEDAPELLPSHDKTWRMRGFFLKWAKKSGFSRWYLPLVKTEHRLLKWQWKYLEYSINLANKAGSGFERIDSSFEGSSTVAKMLLHSIASYREIAHETESSSIWQTPLWSYFEKLPQSPQSSAATTLTSQQPSMKRQDPLLAKRWLLTEDTNVDYHFLIKYFRIKVCTLFLRPSAFEHLIDYIGV